jgi:hypothetical protein
MTGNFVLFEVETAKGGVDRVFRLVAGGRADRREIVGPSALSSRVHRDLSRRFRLQGDDVRFADYP